jgi:exopolyphosphatase / guanosine-5'-triphosphate,3'-diphosphate pyrophosphatase
MKLATMDIGSGTVRVMLGHQENGGRFERGSVHRTITRLADDFADGHIAASSMDRTVAAAKLLAQEARAFGAVEIRVSCTGVARRADNAAEFLSHLRDQAGLSPVLITGELEAAISSLGAATELGFLDRSFLLLDVGGFSTELAHVELGKVIGSISVDIGSVMLAQQYLESDPPTRTELNRCGGAVRTQLEKLRVLGDLSSVETLVGTAGSITNLAAMSLKMERYEPGRLNRVSLERAKIQDLIDLLVSMPAADRLALPGLEKGREDTLPAGGIIAREVLDFLSRPKLVVTEGGVLEGLAVWEAWPPGEGCLLTA